ncbi:MAG: ABC transporter ATP-binding protein [Gemmatimonadota bacterium]
MKLTVRDLAVSYPPPADFALEDVSLSVEAGRMVAVLGPNGSGKTTLVRALLGLVPIRSGAIELDGRPIDTWKPAERARRIGVLPQREETAVGWRVHEIVMFGRYATLSPFAAPAGADHAIVEEAMRRCDVTDLRSRKVDTLSGGEWQRVRLARALAQEPDILLLDEPGTALDLRHEMEIFELLRTLVDEGLAALVITHHVNLAARLADELVIVSKGRVARRGSPADVMEAVALSDVFDWPVTVEHLADGAPQLIPERRRGRELPLETKPDYLPE